MKQNGTGQRETSPLWLKLKRSQDRNYSELCKFDVLLSFFTLSIIDPPTLRCVCMYEPIAKGAFDAAYCTICSIWHDGIWTLFVPLGIGY